MSESENTKSVKPLSDRQYNYIVALATELKPHLTEEQRANLSAKLKARSEQTSVWGSSAIEKLKRIQTQVALAKLRAQREEQTAKEAV